MQVYHMQQNSDLCLSLETPKESSALLQQVPKSSRFSTEHKMENKIYKVGRRFTTSVEPCMDYIFHLARNILKYFSEVARLKGVA